MQDELLDIVDENDIVIGQMPFKEVHDKQLLHRFVRVLLLNSKGEFILQVRAQGIPDAGKMDAPGGHVESDESYGQTAIREMYEEMGIHILSSDLKNIGSIDDRSRLHIENMIGRAYVAVHDGPYKIQENELTELKFFSESELLSMVKKTPEKFSPKLLQCLVLWESLNG